MDVKDILLWRDVKVSAIVFVSGFALLVCLTQFSVVSVITNTALICLAPMLALRLLLTARCAFQRTEFEHPLKSYLAKDIEVSKDKADQVGERVAEIAVSGTTRLKQLFLVDDFTDSVKLLVVLYRGYYMNAQGYEFYLRVLKVSLTSERSERVRDTFSTDEIPGKILLLVVLYILSYMAQWFSGITMTFIVFIGAFTIPKVYDMYKTEIDSCVGKIKSAVGDVTEKISAKMPLSRGKESTPDNNKGTPKEEPDEKKTS